MLSLQCGKATAVFVSSRDRDFVAEVGKCGSRLLDLFSLVLWPSVLLTAPPSINSTRMHEYLQRKSRIYDVTFFSSSTAVTHRSVFLSTFLRIFEARLKAIAASAT